MYIELEHISKYFGTFKASDDVSFGIEKGKLVGLLGPSGSGKTTILRMLAGLEKQDEGDVIIDGKKVGYLKYSHIYDRIEIDDLFVSIDNRNQGIGNKLMSYIVWKAIDTHSVNITLEVRVSNTIARNLYKKYGFREVALRKSYYGDEDGILMEKQVM